MGCRLTTPLASQECRHFAEPCSLNATSSSSRSSVVASSRSCSLCSGSGEILSKSPRHSWSPLSSETALMTLSPLGHSFSNLSLGHQFGSQQAPSSIGQCHVGTFRWKSAEIGQHPFVAQLLLYSISNMLYLSGGITDPFGYVPSRQT